MDNENKTIESEVDNELKKYLPLAIIVLCCLSASWVLSEESGYGIQGLMHYFMGLFLFVFALLKFFDLPGFTKSFKKYCLGNNYYYALAYPFIEFLLALAYLGFFYPRVCYCMTIIIMSLNAYTVYKQMQKKEVTKCACLGTQFNLPVGFVTLAENILMVVMAMMLFFT